MESVQVRELESPESGLDVVGDEVLIPREGGLPNRSAHGVCKPAVQVVANGRATRVKNDPTVPIRHSLRKLRRNLCSRSPIQNLALRPFHGVDRVAGLPATILTMADTAFVVSAFLRHDLLLSLHQFSGFHVQRARELANGRGVGGPSPEFQLVDGVVGRWVLRIEWLIISSAHPREKSAYGFKVQAYIACSLVGDSSRVWPSPAQKTLLVTFVVTLRRR